jgi:hypothetical protein
VEAPIIIFVVVAAWYWFAGAQARERAVLAARRACERHGQQLLDETVLLERLRPRRDRSGRMRLRREYSFEFSGGGEVRSRGSLALFGGRVVDLQLQLPDGTLYDTH